MQHKNIYISRKQLKTFVLIEMKKRQFIILGLYGQLNSMTLPEVKTNIFSSRGHH